MKKKIVTKIITILATAAVIGATLAGCGSSSNGSAQTSGSSSDESTQSSGSEATGADAPVEVTTIHAVTGGAPAPYMSVNEAGEPEGFDIAVFEALIDRLPQYELEWTVTSDYLTGLLSGQYDVAVNNLAYRAERAESYFYSFPYKLTDKVFIQRTDAEPVTSLAEAAERGYSIEVGAGGAVTNALEAWNEANPDKQINIIYTEADFLVRYQHILDGQVDFGCDDSPIFAKYAEEFGFTDLVGVTLDNEAMADVLPSVYTYFLFSKDDAGAALRAELDAELKAMYEDGTLAQLSQEYFGLDVTPPADQFVTEPN